MVTDDRTSNLFNLYYKDTGALLRRIRLAVPRWLSGRNLTAFSRDDELRAGKVSDFSESYHQSLKELARLRCSPFS